MRLLTTEWVDKAEADYRSARRELVVTDEPSPDVVCFHAQQCSEKCLKARLVEADIAFSRTHDLTVLLSLVTAVEPGWASLRAKLHQLSAHAVESRYPGVTATIAEAEAFDIANELLDEARHSLGL